MQEESFVHRQLTGRHSFPRQSAITDIILQLSEMGVSYFSAVNLPTDDGLIASIMM